jgi:hypothetical protein
MDYDASAFRADQEPAADQEMPDRYICDNGQ